MPCKPSSKSLALIRGTLPRVKSTEATAVMQGRLVRDALEILFASGTQNSLIREKLASFTRRCGTLELTLSDILKLNHLLDLAKLTSCPQVNLSPRAAKAKR